MEKKKYPDSTYRILTYDNDHSDFRYDEAVDWAVEMLQYGYETPGILMLAAVTKSTDAFECKYYLDRVFEELNWKTIQGDDGLAIASVWHILQKIATGEKVRSNLYKLEVASKYDPDSAIYDFCELSSAWHELEEYGKQWEIDANVKLEEMEDFTIFVTKDFIEANRKMFDACFPPQRSQ